MQYRHKLKTIQLLLNYIKLFILSVIWHYQNISTLHFVTVSVFLKMLTWILKMLTNACVIEMSGYCTVRVLVCHLYRLYHDLSHINKINICLWMKPAYSFQFHKEFYRILNLRIVHDFYTKILQVKKIWRYWATVINKHVLLFTNFARAWTSGALLCGICMFWQDWKTETSQMNDFVFHWQKTTPSPKTMQAQGNEESTSKRDVVFHELKEGKRDQFSIYHKPELKQWRRPDTLIWQFLCINAIIHCFTHHSWPCTACPAV